MSQVCNIIYGVLTTAWIFHHYILEQFKRFTASGQIGHLVDAVHRCFLKICPPPSTNLSRVYSALEIDDSSSRGKLSNRFDLRDIYQQLVIGIMVAAHISSTHLS